jgi:hypothetical protein
VNAKTLVIHSGTYKTGSSAIQVYLSRANHYDVLDGARFPKTGRSLAHQHGNLTAQLRSGRAFIPERGGWDELLAELTTGPSDTTVVSSEHFAALEPEHLRVIGEKTRAAGVQVRWIHYLRDQPSFYNAFYVERLVTMRPEFLDIIDLPFEEFGTWSPIDLGIMKYSRFAEQILEQIPGVDLRLRPFSRSHLVGGDAVQDFCATAEIPYRAELTSSTNVGTGWRTVETARRLTPLVKRGKLRRQLLNAPNRHALRMRWMMLIRSEFVNATNDLGWNDESAIYLTPQFRERLLADYAEDNERVAELAGFDWPAIVAAEPVKEYNIGDYSEVSAEELMSVMERVVPVIFRPPQEIRDLLKSMAPEPAPPPSLARRAVRAARRRLS